MAEVERDDGIGPIQASTVQQPPTALSQRISTYLRVFHDHIHGKIALTVKRSFRQSDSGSVSIVDVGHSHYAPGRLRIIAILLRTTSADACV